MFCPTIVELKLSGISQSPGKLSAQLIIKHRAVGNAEFLDLPGFYAEENCQEHQNNYERAAQQQRTDDPAVNNIRPDQELEGRRFRLFVDEHDFRRVLLNDQGLLVKMVEGLGEALRSVHYFLVVFHVLFEFFVQLIFVEAALDF